MHVSNRFLSFMLAFGLGAPAFAQFDTYTSEFDFFNALGGADVVTEGFEGFDLDEVIPAGTQVGDVIFESFPTEFGGLAGDNYFVFDFRGLHVERDGIPGEGDLDFYFPGDEVGLSFTNDVFAVAFYFNVGPSNDVSDYMYVETPVGTAFTGGPVQDLSGMFFAGIISKTPFSTATIGSTFDAPTGWNGDNLIYAPVAGDFVTHNILLSGCQEVPPVFTTGVGEASVSLNTATNQVTVFGSYDNMSSDVSMAHIHGLAAKGQNAGVIVTLVTTGGTSGEFNGVGTLTDEQAQGFIDGLTYVNVHTFNNPGGEIRGQIENPCPGDFNADGAKNILDFVAFQGAWVDQECAGDANHDLTYNILDFVAFQGIFQAPCD